MSASNKLPLPGSVGKLYGVSRADWEAINRRNRDVAALQGLAAVVQTYIQNYQALLTVCDAWGKRTFPAIIAQSAQVGQMANGVAQQLSVIETGLHGIGPNESLPASIALIFKIQFGAFAARAATLQTQWNQASPGLQDYVDQNRITDKDVAAIVAQLGPGWSSIGGPLGAVETALNDTVDSWSNISTHFAAVSEVPADLSTGAIAALDFDGARSAWLALAQSALAFNQMATTLS